MSLMGGRLGWTSLDPAEACPLPTTDETSKKIAHAKAVATKAQDTATRVQSRLRDMQRNLEQWQGQYGGLQSQDLGQVVLDAGRSGGPPAHSTCESRWAGGGRALRPHPPLFPAAVSTLEKTLPQLLAKLNLLESRGGHNASLALSASIGRVRELIAQARGAASKVGMSARRRGHLGNWVVNADGPYTLHTGQGVHEVQRALRGAAACPSGPH